MTDPGGACIPESVGLFRRPSGDGGSQPLRSVALTVGGGCSWL